MAIRILHIFAPSFATRFGGQTIWWKSVFEHWNAPDIEHYVLDYSENQIVPSKEAFEFEYSDIQKGTTQWRRALWIIDLFKNLIKYQKKYDILHVHVLWWGGLLIAPWAKLKNIPALYESILLDSDTPGGVLKEKFGKVKLYCLKLYKAILTISDYLAEDYRRFSFSNEQVFTLMNYVDTDLFSPSRSADEKLFLRQKLSLPPNATLLVFVGSVIQRKGVDVLLRAFIQTCSRGPDLFLVIVGPKNKKENPSLDEDFICDLYSLINENNLSDRVFFVGLIQERGKLAEIYRASDIFVFPSNNEGLGNVVLEAMASKLPVVVSQLPVLEKIIKHEVSGLFVPIGDAEALRDAILALLADPIQARKIGHNAQHYVKTQHGFLGWQAQLTEFYKNLLS